ncbi:MAG: hypothetical protein J4473_00455 [Candidatus Aenigmarchaeota archaeon]|nr:hypothetical protein [Candidatus Aenigmarchaeota archaeon]
MKFDLYTHGSLILGAMFMFLGMRFGSRFYMLSPESFLSMIIGLFFILIAGIFWISAAINWER